MVNPKFSDEENRTFYGKCTNPNGHGHNFELEVSVSGGIDSAHGRAFPPAQLDAVVEENVITPLDHKNLNFDISDLNGQVTTGENLTRLIWQSLVDKLPAGSLKRLRLNMSPSNSFEYYGEN